MWWIEKLKNMRSWAIFLILIILGLSSSVAAGPMILVSDNRADLSLAISISLKEGYSIAVTTWNEYSESLARKIISEKPDRVIIIGGPVAVPERYEEVLESNGIGVERFGGETRQQTSIKVMERFGDNLKPIVVDGRKPILLAGYLPVYLFNDPSEISRVAESRTLLVSAGIAGISGTRVELVGYSSYGAHKIFEYAAFKKIIKPEELSELVERFMRSVEVRILEEGEEWQRYTIREDQVEFSIERRDGSAILKLRITYPSGGFRTDWGEAKISDGEITVELEVLRWSGPAIQVITTQEHEYNLGEIPSGTYTLRIFCWGLEVLERKIAIP